MGREVIAVCHWQGDTAEATMHLDANELTLRGGIRAAIARSAITDVSLCDDGLSVTADGHTLVVELGEVDAGRWERALLKAPPTLAEKLGVSASHPAFFIGLSDDPVLVEALSGATVSNVVTADILIAIIENEAGLFAAEGMAAHYPERFIWMIYPKGKDVTTSGAAIRKYMRGVGLMDSKSCAVSDRLTATRYRRPATSIAPK